MFLLDAARNDGQLRLRLSFVNTGFEPSDQVRAVQEATRQLVLRRLIRNEQFTISQRKLKTRRQHADNLIAFAIDREPASDDACVAAESSLPQGVTKDRDS